MIAEGTKWTIFVNVFCIVFEKFCFWNYFFWNYFFWNYFFEIIFFENFWHEINACVRFDAIAHKNCVTERQKCHFHIVMNTKNGHKVYSKLVRFITITQLRRDLKTKNWWYCFLRKKRTWRMVMCAKIAQGQKVIVFRKNGTKCDS